MLGINAETPAHQREEHGRYECADGGGTDEDARRRHEPEQHREGDEEHDDREDLEDQIVLEEDAKVTVLLEDARRREREAHQDRTPEKEHREGDDLLPVTARAAHLPDLIYGRLDREEEAEGDDGEDDRAEG